MRHVYNLIVANLITFSKELMTDEGALNSDESTAINFYSARTAQIEIVRDKTTMEEIVFPIPEICRFLTEETKKTTFFETEMDDKESKIADFFERSEGMYREMAWQERLQVGLSVRVVAIIICVHCLGLSDIELGNAADIDLGSYCVSSSSYYELDCCLFLSVQ